MVGTVIAHTPEEHPESQIQIVQYKCPEY